jgi:hypothetical protein
MTGPIKPHEVGSAKAVHIPAQVFDAFNTEITIRFANGEAIVDQQTVVERLVQAGLTRSEIYQNGWLNIEEAYREVGWIVKYNKPGYNETGNATFTFRIR